MPWLVHGNRVLASLEVAEGATARRRGLLGRDSLQGALWLSPARSVHTLGMRFPIDTAFCDRHGRVLRVATMRPNRVSRVVRRAHTVVEAPAGAFAHWGIGVGDTLEVRHG